MPHQHDMTCAHTVAYKTAEEKLCLRTAGEWHASRVRVSLLTVLTVWLSSGDRRSVDWPPTSRSAISAHLGHSCLVPFGQVVEQTVRPGYTGASNAPSQVGGQALPQFLPLLQSLSSSLPFLSPILTILPSLNLAFAFLLAAPYLPFSELLGCNRN